MAGNSACVWVADGWGEEYDEWVNDLLANAPDRYDGDESAESIVTTYVRDLEALREAAEKVVAMLSAQSNPRRDGGSKALIEACYELAEVLGGDVGG